MDANTTGKQNGIVIGVVTSLEDPEKIGRVRVKFPHLGGKESYWAKVATLMAGPNRGSRFVPEVDDEVLVAFLQGDPQFPFVLGSLWSKTDPPPPDSGKQADNNWRYFKSRSGHIIRFDDTKNAEKIELIDKANKHRIVIDASGDKIEIICDSGNVSISAPKGKVQVKGSEVSIESTGNMTLNASGNMTIKGSKVDIN